MVRPAPAEAIMKPSQWPLRFLAAILVLSIAALLVASAPIGAVQYYYQDIGVGCDAYAINNQSQVVGRYFPNGSSNPHAFLWTANDGLKDLGTLGGYPTGASRINDIGQVVGYSIDSSGIAYGFLWTTNNGMQKLGLLPGFGSGIANGINNKGQIAGCSTDSQGLSHAILWDSNNNITDLGTLSGSCLEWACGINDSGKVVGSVSFNLSQYDNKPFMWTSDAGITALSTLGGNEGDAYAINNNGQVVGRSLTSQGHDHAVLWDAASNVQDLDNLGDTFSQALEINNFGQVVGASQLNEYVSYRAFLWTADSGMQDLNSLTVNVPAGVTLTTAYSINDLGQIVGVSNKGAFLLTPQVEVANIPQIYALCIGTRNNQGQGKDFRGDLAATDMANIFKKYIKNDSHVITMSADITQGINKNDIQANINELNNEMKPGDLLLIYITGHGGNAQDTQGDAYVLVGPDQSSISAEGVLSDTDLYNYLKGMDDKSKWVMIDACHSGGFWGLNSLSDDGGLERLKNIGFLAATWNPYGDVLGRYITAFIAGGAHFFPNYYGLVTYALEDAFTLTSNGSPKAAGSDGVLTIEELYSYVHLWGGWQQWPYDWNVTYGEMVFGDPVTMTQDLWNPSCGKTGDVKAIKFCQSVAPIINFLLME
jgi:probable HAF family extracellular repeat protein